MINMEVTCEFNNFRCKEQNCYITIVVLLITKNLETTWLSQIHVLSCLCTILYNVFYYNFSTVIKCACLYSHCIYTCRFVSAIW